MCPPGNAMLSSIFSIQFLRIPFDAQSARLCQSAHSSLDLTFWSARADLRPHYLSSQGRTCAPLPLLFLTYTVVSPVFNLTHAPPLRLAFVTQFMQRFLSSPFLTRLLSPSPLPSNALDLLVFRSLDLILQWLLDQNVFPHFPTSSFFYQCRAHFFLLLLSYPPPLLFVWL